MEPGLRSQCPHFLLCHAPQREARPRQLGLGEAVEHIGLVLGAILGAQKQIPTAPRVKAHLGIVAGGNPVIAQLQRRIQKSAEFHRPVAEDAGVRCPALLIDPGEGLDDILQKFLLPAKQVKYQPQLRCGVGRHLGLFLAARAQQHRSAADGNPLPLQ